ncbi:MAG TPA: NAD(P)-dependent alcohol dehydrogenase [Dongiaceae bacterium]|nr:NAD(P)-dependent alcohol dehydrogenase [Dongiaceae bacterium]
MKAVRIEGFASQATLVVDETRKAPVCRHNVLVEVHHASVNPLDWKMQSALALIPRNVFTPVILGRDFSGVVAGVSNGVSDYQVGDRVFGFSMNFIRGTFAEYASVNVKHLAKVPDNVSLRDAATLPTAGVIVLQSLRKAHFIKGERIAIVGASGGVGTFAVQIAKALGAHVTGICSTNNLELVRSLGADQVVDYTQPDYLQQISQCDIVFDTTTGIYPIQQWYPLLAKGGRYVSIAPDGKTMLSMYLNRLLAREPYAFFHSAIPSASDLKELSRLMAEHRLKPVIDSQFSLSDINAAFERSRSKRARGKIVIDVKESD